MGDEVSSLVNGTIRLESDGIPEEEVRAFVQVFEAAWKCVPLDCQRIIESFWRDSMAPADCREKPNVKARYKPKIMLFDDTKPCNRGVPKVQGDGHVILFPCRLLRDMGEQLATVAVAHELAHVCFYATSEPTHWPDHTTAETYDMAEHLVDERLLQWGFDVAKLELLDAWMNARGFSRFHKTSQTQPLA